MKKVIEKLNKAKKSEKGFTLVELLVVILIIGILIAIAVPAFLGQQDSGQDADTKSRLDTVFSDVKTLALDNGGNFSATAVNTSAKIATLVGNAEPDLTVTASAAGSPTTANVIDASPAVNTIYVGRAGADQVVIGARSSSGSDCTAVVRTGNNQSTQPSCN